MAGVSTPEMAAAVSNAGALGSLGLAALDVETAAEQIAQTRQKTQRPFGVNFFCHEPARRDAVLEQSWIEHTAPLFSKFGAVPPVELNEIYRSFRDNDAMFRMLLETRPAVVSFHFGLPRPDQISALHEVGCFLIASATRVFEGQVVERAGIDAVVAQGWGAGGHRGIFDPDGPDDRCDTETLTRRLVRETNLPVIAAGGLMDGQHVVAALGWGASAAQLGTAFVGCPESAADEAYRDRLSKGGSTVMTRVISGRPARCLSNAFTAWGKGVSPDGVPAYPCAYDLAKALNGVAKAAGETGYGAQWSGAGCDRARSMPAGKLVKELIAEMQICS